MVRLTHKFNQAIKLRRQGHSLREISEILNISKTTASLWCRNIKLSKQAEKRLSRVSSEGTTKGLKAIQNRRNEERKNILKKAENCINDISFGKNIYKLLGSLIYICEGTTEVAGGVMFVNSDPKLVRLFLFLFRKSFILNEKKFSVCVHLHGYHKKDKQLKYWSDVTRIPLKQFIKPYQKKNTGKRIRKNYQGCVSIRYYDSKVSRELRNVYEVFLGKILN